jgi:cobalt-zinc-cadmium efflux system outer membrane protein
MNLNFKSIIIRYRVPDLLFILALGCSSQVLAEKNVINTPSRENLERFDSEPLINTKDDLSLRDAIHLMLQNNPELSSFSKEVRALDGIIIQAGKFRNPELAVES